MMSPTAHAARRGPLATARKASVPGARAQALRRLEREHVALLLAIAELETGASKASKSGSLELRVALLSLLRIDLTRAQYALRRVAAGQYGVCDRCGKRVAARQMDLNPATTRCASCAAQTRRGSLSA
jgi:RNA polymerase-binding transcription factor DksA